MNDPHDLGRRGETLAAAFLAGAGWAIVSRNFRVGHKEIDLIVRRGATVAFVEVKTRTGRSFGHPLDAITRAKRREIEFVARFWIARFGRPGDQYRFDAIAIDWDSAGAPRVDHVADAWRL